MQPSLAHLPVILKEDVWRFLMSCHAPSLELLSSRTTPCYFTTPVLVEPHQLTRIACHILSQIVSGLGLLFHLRFESVLSGRIPPSKINSKGGTRMSIPDTNRYAPMEPGSWRVYTLLMSCTMLHMEAHDWYRIWCSFPPSLYFRDVVALAKQLQLWDREVGKWDHMPNSLCIY